MSNSTDEVLAQIDGAIADWQVGPDAMRCNAPAGAGLMSMPTPQIDLEALARAGGEISAAMDRFAQHMVDAGRLIFKMLEDPATRRLLGLPRRDEHHPPALCINGAEYRRRQRGRR